MAGRADGDLLAAECGRDHREQLRERGPLWLAALPGALEVAPDRAHAWAFMRSMEEIVWAIEDGEPEDLRLHLAVASALAS